MFLLLRVFGFQVMGLPSTFHTSQIALALLLLIP